MSILTESLAGKLKDPIRGLAVAGPGAARLGRAPVGGLSHVGGPTEDALWRMTVPELLARTVERYATRDAAVFAEHGVRFTWSEFAGSVDALAAGLLAIGLGKGDRIGIWSPNRREWLLAQFATARIGLILVTINPAYRLEELEYALNKSGCRALIAASRFKSTDYLSMIRSLAPEIDSCEPGRLCAARLPVLRSVIRLGAGEVAGMLNFDSLPDRAGPAQRLRLDAVTRSLEPDDPINIQFTSGTTGAPKGATLTHSNIVNNARFVTRAIRLTECDRLCIPVPLYHCFGMVLGTLGCATKGACMVFPGEGFDPAEALAALDAERCTALYGVPTMFVAMLESPAFAETDLSALRTGIMAGAPCLVEVMRKVMNDMNMRDVTIAYGMTETSPVSFQSAVDDPVERRVSTVGRVHPHVEARVVDTDGNTVPVDVQGELLTRGYAVMRGYWEDEALTREAVSGDGWMQTGDLAVIDGEGYCTIVGRVKDMIIRGGENIYPREVEEFLIRHPKVQDVQVFGVSHERLGEEVAAWIVPQEGQGLDEEDIRAHCEGRIAHFKIPRHIRFVQEIPMTVTGKPQKFVMRERMAEELGRALPAEG